jgi:hypothetical protein
MAYTDPKTWATDELVTATLLNTELRDNLDAILPTADTAWSDWTATYTGLTVGAGTVVSRYQVIAGTVIGYWHFVMGSGSSIASGVIISLPVTASSSQPTGLMNLGPAFIQAAGGAYEGFTQLNSAASMRPVVFNASGTYLTQALVTATVPATFTTNDDLVLCFRYEAA